MDTIETDTQPLYHIVMTKKDHPGHSYLVRTPNGMPAVFTLHEAVEWIKDAKSRPTEFRYSKHLVRQ